MQPRRFGGPHDRVDRLIQLTIRNRAEFQPHFCTFWVAPPAPCDWVSGSRPHRLDRRPRLRSTTAKWHQLANSNGLKIWNQNQVVFMNTAPPPRMRCFCSSAVVPSARELRVERRVGSEQVRRSVCLSPLLRKDFSFAATSPQRRHHH
jgi:hypothetical protein